MPMNSGFIACLRAKRRLKQVAVGRRGGIPADRAYMRGEHLRGVQGAATELPPTVVVEVLRADLGIPKNLQALTLGVMGNARKADGSKIVSSTIHGGQS
jgi:hypothetical protein